MTKKFVTYKHITDDADAVNAWYAHCRKTVIPYITICTRRTYADIQWDYISLPKRYDEILSQKGLGFAEGLKAIFLKYSSKNSSFRVGPVTASFIDIEIANAETLATDVYDYICAELNLVAE